MRDMKVLDYKVECPSCKKPVRVVAYPSKQYSPQFAKHLKGKSRLSGYCTMGSFPTRGYKILVGA